MKRMFICALPLVALACGSVAKTNNGRGSGGATTSATGGTTHTGTGGTTTATGGTTTATGGTTAATGGTITSATGGTTRTGAGGTSTATSGTATTTGGTAASATGGGTRTGTGTGGTAGTGTGGRAGTGGLTSNGGVTSQGGRTSPGIDGGAATGGVAGGPGTIATGPIVKDPITAAADLPHYYISPTGDDSKSGTSPETAWKTLTNIPKDKAAAVFFERGGTWKAPGAPARGRDGPAAFNVPKGSVWTSYGEGDKRPILAATEQTADTPTGAVLMPGGDTLLAGLGFTGRANFGLLLMSDNNVVQDCEIDGNIADSLIQLGFSVRGHKNLIVGNYIHSLHVVILDSGNVNTSGGAEAIVVNGTDHEIAYNTIDDCWTPNETLGGAEGGCLEIIARTPGEVVENILFNHNQCSRSVGLFEACAGNFAGTAEKIQEHHAVVRNTTLAYNVVVDAMWLYLLQTVNTDMDKLVFEHNTLIHGPANTDIPQQGAPGFGNFYDTDRFIPATSCSTAADCGSTFAVCLGGSCAYQTKAQPGQIIVRNNLFVVLAGATAATMKLPPGPDDVVSNIYSPKAPSGVTASAGKVTVVADPGLTNTFRLTSTSPAVDKASTASVRPWPDFDGKTVPCGSAPDVGAIEYCPEIGNSP